VRLVNAVGTRAVSGEHDALVRWYADHVHMLMAFGGLQGAALHRRIGADGSGAPDYLCLYDFADRAAFEAYEHSDVHKNASHDRAQGWGRDGIEITLRSQFERLYQRQARDDGGTQPRHVQAWQSPHEPSLAIERALAARAGSDSALALLRTTAWPSKAADYLTIAPQPLAAAAAPALNLRWQGAYELLLQWSR
jgi:hypothetical protein